MEHDVKFIQLLGKLTIMFGIGMVLFPIIFGTTDLILILSATYSSIEDLGAGYKLFLGFSIIAGGLTIALGFFIVYVGKNYNPEDQYLIYAGIVLWFIIDSIASFFYGWEYNLILNILFVGIMITIFNKAYRESKHQDRIEGHIKS